MTLVRLALIVVVAALNVLLVHDVLSQWLQTGGGSDWSIFVRATGDDPYRWPSWRWSPVAGWAFTVIVPMGLMAWQALHVAAVALVPEPKIQLVMLVAAPFWWDVVSGNIMVFVFVAAYWMLRGHPAGTFATLAIALLVPRPLMLPLVAFALLYQPAWRLRFAAMFAVHALLVAVSGYGGDWIRNLVAGQSELGQAFNLAPSAEIGLWWFVLAAPLAVWAFARRRIGLAVLLASPYWLPNYLLMPFLDLRLHHAHEGRAAGASATSASLERGGTSARGITERLDDIGVRAG